MNQLPTEIVNIIFLQLSFNQKLECMLVCREWANIIRTSCLFHTVDIASINAFESFISIFLEQPDRAKQVKRLIIANYYDISFDTGSLCWTFPHLNFLCLKRLREESHEFRLDFEREKEGLENLRNQIKEVVDFDYCDYTQTLLNCGVCPNLTSLTLEIIEFVADPPTQSIIFLLQNAPNLLNLTMTNATFSYSIFETLSNYLPKLETLTLYFLKMNGVAVFPTTVTPWSSIIKLSIQPAEIPFEAEISLLEYISRKYTSLESFEFSGPEQDRWNGSEINELFKNGLIPFVQRYGRQFKSLKIESISEEEELNIFKKMDEFDYRLQCLNVFDVWHVSVFKMLYLSQQYCYIQELVLNGVDSSEVPYEHLNQFTSLTKLELMYITCDDYRAIINLSSLLEICSNRLESLKLGDVVLQLNNNSYSENSDNSEQQYQLKSLAFSNCDIPLEFCSFIAKRLQNLRNLGLDSLIPSPMLLDLPNIHLSNFSLMVNHFIVVLEVSVKTLNDNKEKRYPIYPNAHSKIIYDRLFDIHGVLICNTVAPLPLNESVHHPHVQLVCASVESILLNSFLAC